MSNKLLVINGGNVPKTYSKEIYTDISTISNNKLKNMSGESSLQNHSINKLVNIQSIFNSLHNIFTWIPGQRILDPEFGSILYSLLYNGINTFTTEQIITEIKTAILRWEPRVKVVGIVNSSNTQHTETNTIQLDVLFTVPSLNNNQQYVYTYTQTNNDR